MKRKTKGDTCRGSDPRAISDGIMPNKDKHVRQKAPGTGTSPRKVKCKERKEQNQNREQNTPNTVCEGIGWARWISRVDRSLKCSRAHYNAHESVQGHAWHAHGCATKCKQAQTRVECNRER